jgi:hypothetical protein
MDETAPYSGQAGEKSRSGVRYAAYSGTHNTREFMQFRNDVVMGKGDVWPEAYFEGGLDLCFLFVSGKSSSRGSASAGKADGERKQVWSLTCKFQNSRPLKRNEREIGPDLISAHGLSVTHCDKELVLIGEVQRMEAVEFAICVSIRLERYDLIDDLFAGQLYLSRLYGSHKGLLVSVPEWELNGLGPRHLSSDQREHEEVQRGSEVVNCVASDQGDLVGDGLVALDGQASLLGLWSYANDRLEGLLRQKGFDLPVQVIDVMFGPLDLESRWQRYIGSAHG